ncbi:MAG: low molecular weight phosphatase family protein [Halovenus sp.]
MAAAFAEQERSERGLEDTVEIHSGGTEPADAVHEVVVAAMAEVGIDMADRSPKWVAELAELEHSDYLVTMGCSIAEFDPARYGVESRDWILPNPDGQDMETVRDIRDEIEAKVGTLFDEIERLVEKERTSTGSANGLIPSIRDFLSP